MPLNASWDEEAEKRAKEKRTTDALWRDSETLALGLLRTRERQQLVRRRSKPEKEAKQKERRKKKEERRKKKEEKEKEKGKEKRKRKRWRAEKMRIYVPKNNGGTTKEALFTPSALLAPAASTAPGACRPHHFRQLGHLVDHHCSRRRSHLCSRLAGWLRPGHRRLRSARRLDRQSSHSSSSWSISRFSASRSRPCGEFDSVR